MTKSGKHCGKRRNCLFGTISSFATMFSKSCLLQRQKGSIWGKGLIKCTSIEANCHYHRLNSFTPVDAFAADAIRKYCGKTKIVHDEQFCSIATMFSPLFNNYTFNYVFFSILPRCFQSRLLQICHMWERN